MFLGDVGDVGAGGFFVSGDGDGADEAEIYDVAGEDRVVAVAEGLEDVGLGEHLLLMIEKMVVLRTMPTSQNRDMGHPAGDSI